MIKRKGREEIKEKQLGLGIKEPFKNRFLKRKDDFRMLLRKLEAKRFLKDPVLWSTVTITTVFTIHQFLLIRHYFSSLPQYLPIYRYYMASSSKLISKNFIFLYPAISIFTIILSLSFSSSYYSTEKSLTKLLLFSTTLCVFAQSVLLIYLTKSF